MKKILLISMLGLLVAPTAFSQVINFQDPTFKDFLLYAQAPHLVAKDATGNLTNIDKNMDKEIDQNEADQIVELKIKLLAYPEKEIYNVDELNLFTNLQSLKLDFMHVDHFTFSDLVHLRHLDIGYNYENVSIELINLPDLDSLTLNILYAKLLDINIVNCPIKYFNSNDPLSSNKLNPLASIDTYIGNIESDSLGICDLSGLVNLRYLKIPFNNSINSIVFPIPNKIEYLEANNLNLQIFNRAGFEKIVNLDLDNNNLTVLDLTGLSTLQTLKCSTQSNKGLTDLKLNGCSGLKRIYCHDNDIEVINLSGHQNLEYVFFEDSESFDNISGLAHVNLSNCPKLETVIVSGCDLLKDIDLSNCEALAEVVAQSCDSLQWLNLSSCSNLNKLYLDNSRLLEFLDLSCTKEMTKLSLINNDALKYIDVKNGHNDFLNGFNLGNINSNVTISSDSFEVDLIKVIYPNNEITTYFTNTPPCKWNTVAGKLLFDINDNGCADGLAIPFFRLNYSSPFPPNYSYTNEEGQFYISIPEDEVDLYPSSSYYDLEDFGLSAPLHIEFVPDTNFVDVDICLNPINDFVDLEIELIPLTIARPGFDASYKIQYRNLGTIPQSSNISLHYMEDFMSLVKSNPGVDSTSANYPVWFFEDLMPFETREIFIDFKLNSPIDPNYPLNSGHLLNFVATINSELEDIDQSNNRSILIQTVVNSFDPNDKTCLEGDFLLKEDVGKFLHYLIRFENTGSAEAINIVVKDVIDTTVFDPASFQIVSSSHSVQTRLTQGHVIEFIFENINLPFEDDTNDGYVLFKMRTRPELQLFDELTNRAEIYFDYNFPIITNTTVTKVVNTVSVDPNEPPFNFTGTIIPNPAGDWFKLDGVSNVYQMEILALDGRMYSHIKGEQSKYSLAGMPSGMYVVRVLTIEGISMFKLIKVFEKN